MRDLLYTRELRAFSRWCAVITMICARMIFPPASTKRKPVVAEYLAAFLAEIKV